MVDIGKRSLAIAEAKRKRREERQAGLVKRFGTTVIPLEAKGIRVPRFGTEPGIFDVRLRRFLTPREVVQRRVKQIVTKAKSDVKALKKEEILELKKLQTTLKDITPTKKELKLRLKAPPTKAEKSVIAKGDVLESKIKNLNKEVGEIEQTKTNLLNALDQAQRAADITKTAQLRLEIDKLRDRIKNFEKRRVDVEEDRLDFNREIQRTIAKTKTIKEIEEIETKKRAPKKKPTFIKAAPTKKELIEKIEIPISKVAPTFKEFKKTVLETGKTFEEASKGLIAAGVAPAGLKAADIFGVPKAVGFAAAGVGEFFGTGIRAIGFLAEQGLTAVERATGAPTEVKIRVPSGTAKLARGAATIPILGEPFKVIQSSPVKGQPGTFELTLRKQAFVKGVQTAAEIELLTAGVGTRFIAGKAGIIAKTISKIPSKTKVGLGEVVARVKAKFPKRAQTFAEIEEEVKAGTLTLEEFKKGFFGKPSKPLTKFEEKELLKGLVGKPKKDLRVKVFGKTKFKEVERELEVSFPKKIGRPLEQKFKLREFDVKPEKEPFTKKEIAEFEEFVRTKAIKEGKPFVETFFKKKKPITFQEKQELELLTKEFEKARFVFDPLTKKVKKILKEVKKPTVKELIELETVASRKQKELISARAQFKKIFPEVPAKERRLRVSKEAVSTLQAGARRIIEAEERALIKLLGKEKAKQFEEGVRTLLEKEKVQLNQLIKEELGTFPRASTIQIQKPKIKPITKPIFGEEIVSKVFKEKAKPITPIKTKDFFKPALPVGVGLRKAEILVPKAAQIPTAATKALEKFGEVSGLKVLTGVSEKKALKEFTSLKTGVSTLTGLKSAQAQGVVSLTALKSAEALKSPQKVLTKTITKGLTTIIPKLKVPTKPIKVTKPKVPPPPLIILPKDKAVIKKKKLVPGFHAFAKEEPFKTSKFRRVSKKPRPLANILERGFKVADNTISQTTEARPTKTLVPPEPPPKKSLRRKFREVKVSGKKKRFIEKRAHAIDTLGEKQKLKVSAFLARERKRAKGLPARKTKGFKKSKRKGGFF